MNELEIAAALCPTPGYRDAERADDQLLVAGQVARRPPQPRQIE